MELQNKSVDQLLDIIQEAGQEIKNRAENLVSNLTTLKLDNLYYLNHEKVVLDTANKLDRFLKDATQLEIVATDLLNGVLYQSEILSRGVKETKKTYAENFVVVEVVPLPMALGYEDLPKMEVKDIVLPVPEISDEPSVKEVKGPISSFSDKALEERIRKSHEDFWSISKKH